MRNIVIAKPGTPEYAHLQFFRTSPRAMKISRDALTSVGASDYLVTRFRLDPLEAGFGLQQISLRNSIIEDVCPVTPNCGAKEQYYRTSDGSCNNVDRPSLGQARTPLHRLTMPLYSDGLMRPRRSVTGDALPSARLVSTSVSPDADRPNNDLTLYVMLWGQFIDHDLTHVPIFRFGDERVNEQIQLTIMHTIWMRFHNVIARELKRLNPHWDDETLYQEARRIVNAMYQHIVYNEWLPIILATMSLASLAGKDIMVEKGLLPLRYGYSNLYDPSIDPTIANEFATVAFRFGHTLVQGMLE
ncbi:Peroxidasin [Portunus trituberculatus]|uniref:Peroxidasin n=1 Tax=Portunus trituberculatus TaxID=210409 RepID=A0A5B7G992_PORTR|nr:Peroxidasin [Portunus trituberculatus]